MNMHRFFTWTRLLLLAAACLFLAGGPVSAVQPDLTKPNYTNSPPLTKFVDSLPGLGFAGRNNLGQYIPVAVPDQITYPGSDYYEIGVQEYNVRMHSDLPALGAKIRGYMQLNAADPTVGVPQYLGPLIVAQRDKPVRIKFVNMLPTGTLGKLFLPVDTTMMGPGTGPLDPNELYTQNRAELHLHGGFTPWISDGTPHQWITPVGEVTSYPTGIQVHNVPDMPDPGPGASTYYYTNQQSARLMFAHDHSYGITRLNVYAGEAMGYLLTDPCEQAMVTAGAIPSSNIPLIIQDKTFVPEPNTLARTDPLWDVNSWGGMGSLWFPHVYMPNQDPNSEDGSNPMGRWDYGPWFWPIFPVSNPLPALSSVPESFMDTPIVNGTAYPYVQVAPTAYRFRILNASNDRTFNLQLYYADTGGNGHGAAARATVTNGVITAITVISGGSGYNTSLSVKITDPNGSGAVATATVTAGVVTAVTVVSGGSGYTLGPDITFAGGGVGGTGAAATAAIVGGSLSTITVTAPGAGYTSAPGIYLVGGHGEGAAAAATVSPTGTITAITVINPGRGYTSAPAVVIGGSTEVKMVDASPDDGLPSTWPTDGRDGGVPDPTTAGPEMIQIGSEGGILPAPVVLANTPIGYEYNRRSVTVLNVSNHTLMLGPAERADIIIDFSKVPAGSKLILYNDAPAPVPGFDTRYDYYTGDPNQVDFGGAPTTLPGKGPNIRTIMQFRVAGTATAPFNLAALQTALPAAYLKSQPAPIVPQTAYPAPWKAAKDTYARIFTGSAVAHDFNFVDVNGVRQSIPVLNKTIQELFDPWGRMNSTLGVEIPFTSALTQTTIPLGYIDPTTETLPQGQIQIWKITHNGVDTHFIHWHLLNVQVINRVGWDGMVKPPDRNELGWKETVRMNPLEDIIVAVQAKPPVVPFAVPVSIRPLDVTRPLGSMMGFTQVDPNTGQPPLTPVTNVMANFGWEYVWHCHILGHEENDMMRPLVLSIPTAVPAAPSNLTLTAPTPPATSPIILNWVNNANNQIGFRVERSIDGGLTYPFRALTQVTTYVDANVVPPLGQYSYRVFAYNVIGDSNSSNIATLASVPTAPRNVTAVAGNGQATVSFSAPLSDGNNPITLYTVTSNPGGLRGTGAGSPIIVTGLTNGISYTFTVTATNAAGTGPASLPSNAIVPASPPGAPTAVVAATGNGQATVSFTAPANGGSPILSYTATSSPGGFFATAATGPLVVTGLNNGTAYTFTVTATNAIGTGPASLPSNSIIPANPFWTNVALQANGGVATASSSYSANFPVTSINDGDRTGANCGAGGTWNDATANVFPDWVQINFSGPQAVTEVDVFSVQDAYLAPVTPTATQTFALYGLTAFTVQSWDGANWVAVPGGTITGNNLVWRKISFAPVTTDRIRVQVNAALASYSRIAEVEAWVGSPPPVITMTAPADGATFTTGGPPITLASTATAALGQSITRVEYYNGGALLTSIPGAGPSFTFDWANVPLGTYTIKARAYDTTGSVADSALATITVNRLNFALPPIGSASASTSYSAAFPAAAVNNGDRKGINIAAGGTWNDATPGLYPDWVQITFTGQKTIGEVDVFSIQDNYTSPVAPTPSMTFTMYGLTAFDVQYWNGSAWVTIPGGSVTGNNLVWKKIEFAEVTTDRIRVQVNAAMASYSRIAEIEAYAPNPTVTITAPTSGAVYTAPAAVIPLAATAAPSAGATLTRVEFYGNGALLGTATTAPYTFAWTNVAAGSYTITARAYDSIGAVGTSAPVTVAVGRINVALQSYGAVATASSAYSAAFPVSAVINGDRKGLNIGAGGTWNDASPGVFPDWVQVAFAGTMTIDEIDVFTLQDNYQIPADPTLLMTFSRYGATAFDVQYWNGAAWVTVSGGTVTGNNKVWKQITFPAVTTDRIRVQVNASPDAYSRLTEIEAWTQ